MLSVPIVTIHGQKKLHECFYFLIENSQATLFQKIDRFENFDLNKNPQNFKAVLFNQKHLISYINSLSFIIKSLEQLQNNEIKFILQIMQIAVKYLSNFFPAYRESFFINCSKLFNSLPIMNYNKFIFRNLLLETIKAVGFCNIPFITGNESIFNQFLIQIVAENLTTDKKILVIE